MSSIPHPLSDKLASIASHYRKSQDRIYSLTMGSYQSLLFTKDQTKINKIIQAMYIKSFGDSLVFEICKYEHYDLPFENMTNIFYGCDKSYEWKECYSGTKEFMIKKPRRINFLYWEQSFKQHVLETLSEFIGLIQYFLYFVSNDLSFLQLSSKEYFICGLKGLHLALKRSEALLKLYQENWASLVIQSQLRIALYDPNSILCQKIARRIVEGVPSIKA